MVEHREHGDLQFRTGFQATPLSAAHSGAMDNQRASGSLAKIVSRQATRRATTPTGRPPTGPWRFGLR
jgi:hypothetical protein